MKKRVPKHKKTKLKRKKLGRFEASINEILLKELEAIKPSKKDLVLIKKETSRLIKALNSELKKKKIAAKAAIGGSFAKGTIIRKGRYDIDIFVQFDFKKYSAKSAQLADILAGVLKAAVKKFKINLERLHGSRDYFRISRQIDTFPLFFELVPVLAIKKAAQALNVTDVSPLHVRYVLRKIKAKPKLADQIRLVKALCHAKGCYGAESYIRGFSGYCLEVLTCYYGSFIALAKAVRAWKPKVILDPAKHYRSQAELLIELNEAKLLSPLVLIDPVQADRNAAAALSNKKFDLFVKACSGFLARPSLSAFAKEELSPAQLRKKAISAGAKFVQLTASSNKLKEDVAGAKLLRFSDLVLNRLKKEGYSILSSDWKFDSEKLKADLFLSFRQPKEVVVKGPPLHLTAFVAQFKRRWPRCTAKMGRIWATRGVRAINVILAELCKKELLEELGIKSWKLLK